MLKKFIRKKILPVLNKLFYWLLEIIDYRNKKLSTDSLIYFNDETESFLNNKLYEIRPFNDDIYWIKHYKNGIKHPQNFYSIGDNYELIGNGIILNEKKQIILEATIFQEEYLNKLLQNHLIIFRKFLKVEKTFIYAISLINFLDNNYYHWALESLTRIVLIYKHHQIDLNDIKIIIREKSKSYLKDSLVTLFNIPEKNIIEWGGKRAIIKKCLIVSFPQYRSEQIGYHVNNPIILNKLREIAYNNIHNEKKPPEYIIISRKNAYQRKLFNIDELLVSFPGYDFKIVYLEELSFKEQVQLFRNAKIVIGAHGAGLTNIIYCRNSLIIEFFPDKRNIRDMCIFFQISQALNIKHFLFKLKSDATTQDMTIDKNTLNSLAEIFKNWHSSTKFNPNAA